jgi:hypothetical protein
MLTLILKNLPKVNLQLNDYATKARPFVIVNKTNIALQPIIDSNLVVNNQLSPQPISYFNSLASLNTTTSFAGYVFNEWKDMFNNDLTLLYNDSAILSLPYMINALSNFYSSMDKSVLINATLSAWPRSAKNTIENLDYSSFSALIVLGSGLIMPLASFAAEIVQEKEV